MRYTVAMYRDPQDGPTTPCSSCRQPTTKEETFFSTEGDLLCRRCHSIAAGHAQVERGRAAQAEAGRGHGAIVGLIAAAQASATAERSHAELAAIAAYARPRAAPAEATCSSCGGVGSLEETTYTPGGALVCKPCFVHHAEVARLAKAKQTTVIKAISLVAFVLLIFPAAMAFLSVFLGC